MLLDHPIVFLTERHAEPRLLTPDSLPATPACSPTTDDNQALLCTVSRVYVRLHRPTQRTMGSEKARRLSRFTAVLFLPLLLLLSTIGGSQATAQPCTAPDCVVAMAGVEAGTSPTCLLCSVTNEANVINADLDDFATISVALGVAGTAFIEVVFGSTQAAGNYAGFVIEDPEGLLDTVLLGTLFVTTYLADSQRETTSGAALSLHDLGGGKKAVEFLTTLSFDEVRLDVASLISISHDVYTYYGYSSQAPLPVAFVAFVALVEGYAVTLRWETASEINNAGFEVQSMSRQTSAPQRPPVWDVLTFVEGHGTTEEPQTYAYRVEGLTPGRHVFRLKQVDYDGTFAYSPTLEVAVAVPGSYHLSAAYPNPFNRETSVSLSVTRRQYIEVAVYDLGGRRTALLYEGVMPAGSTRLLRFEAGDLPSGVYLVRAIGMFFAAHQQAVLIR